MASGARRNRNNVSGMHQAAPSLGRPTESRPRRTGVRPEPVVCTSPAQHHRRMTFVKLPKAARLSVSFALLLSLHGSAARAQTPTPDIPQPMYSVGSAFDVARGRFVLFGGYFRGQYSGNTWEWDGRAWKLVTSQGPTGRNSPTMSYDEGRRQVVLFGGDTRSTGALGDTWTFDGTMWRQHDVPGPSPRSTTQMVYDSRRHRIVLFGGSANGQMLGDTWEWDGERWTQVATDGPSPRTLHGLAYDAKRGRTVLFGGTGVLAPNAPSSDETWEWDGRRWTKSNAKGPSGRDHVSMGYDSDRAAVILHGGGLGEVDPGETWAYDGAWTRITGAGPRRRFARLEFDPGAKAMLLYGGFDRDPMNELWRLKGASWEKVAP